MHLINTSIRAQTYVSARRDRRKKDLVSGYQLLRRRKNGEESEESG